MSPGVIIACPTSPQPSTVTDLAVHQNFPATTTVMQFTGGGQPATVSVRGVAMQIDVLERNPQGTARVFRGFVPVNPATPFDKDYGNPTSLQALEGVAGTPHALDGVYDGLDFADVVFRMDTANGSYVASVDASTASEVLIGAANERGHTGPDYYRLTQYFCPFQITAGASVTDANHQTCGAMIIAMHRRVDFKGVFIEAMFVNASLPTGITDYSGNKPENPGHIIYSSIAIDKGALASGYVVKHFDTFTGETGPTAANLVGPFNTGTRQHLSAPGTAPGWVFSIYNSAVESAARATALWEGRDCATAFSGRGFYPGSPYGWGPNKVRHRDPRAPGEQAFATTIARNGALADGNATQQHITNGTGSAGGAGMVGGRSGVHHAFGELDTNNPGGNLIDGFGMTNPMPEFVHQMRAAAMMCTRRSNHTFMAWNSLLPLVPADALTTFNDTSPEDPNPALVVSLLQTESNDSGPSFRVPSAQFACLSPAGGTIGLRPGGGQTLGGPTTRVWNQLAPGQSFGAAAENPALFVGYSHNIAHAARFHIAYDAWLFGLSVLGRNLSLAYGAYSACHYLAWDIGSGQNNWEFSRNNYCLHAWGSRDLTAMTEGAGQLVARKRSGSSCGPLSTGDNLSYRGRFTGDFSIERGVAWGLLWQFAAAAVASAAYRTKTIGQAAAHNPANLILNMAAYVASGIGVCSSSDNLSPSGTTSPYNDAAHGPTDMQLRVGALPGGEDKGDTEHWTNLIAFHMDYLALMFDAAVDHVPAMKPQVMRTLESCYWILESQSQHVDPQSLVGRIGRPPRCAVSRGLTGTGRAESNVPPNPGTTQSNAIAGDTGWGYWPHPSKAFPPGDPTRREAAGWDFEIQNESLGLLVALRHTDPKRRTRILSLMALRWNLPDTSSIDQLIAAMQRKDTIGATIRARSAPFIAEARLYL